jgi:hypothetical protein
MTGAGEHMPERIRVVWQVDGSDAKGHHNRIEAFCAREPPDQSSSVSPRS